MDLQKRTPVTGYRGFKSFSTIAPQNQEKSLTLDPCIVMVHSVRVRSSVITQITSIDHGDDGDCGSIRAVVACKSMRYTLALWKYN